MRFSVGGNSTRCRTGRCDPPQPRIANRTKEQKRLRCTRIGTSVGGDSEHQHNACRWYDGSLDHSPPWALGAPSSRRRRSRVSTRPNLRGNDTGNWLRADVGEDLPYRAERHDTAVGGHPARPAVKDRQEQRAVRGNVAPTAIDETRSHPPGRAAAVAAVAIHGAENLGAVRHDV